MDFTGFGVVTAGGTASTTPVSFGGANGCQTDVDTGLVLMGHRYYDTRIGRFISQDPIKDGRNWYAYCDNNPVNVTDPLGLWADPFSVPSGTSTNQMITDTVQNGGLPGETYDVTTNGKVTSSFTIPGGSILSWNGFHILVPPGVSIGRNIGAAKNFMASNASKSTYHYGWHGSKTGQKYDVNKIAALLIGNVDTGQGQDYKTKNSAYDLFGHVNYAAVATELGFDIDSVVAGQQFAHFASHGLGSGFEGTGGEYIGQAYDRQLYNPGPALFDTGDAFSAFVNYKTGL